MAPNTNFWVRRSKKLYATSSDAWNDIAKKNGWLTRKNTLVAHTKYFWRWKVKRLKSNKHGTK